MRYIVSYSGGKDSTALLLWAIAKYGRDNIIVVSADTGAEFPETFEYFEYIEKHLGVKIHIVKSELWDYFSLVRYMKKFYDQKLRRCTSSLKLEPLAKWITVNCNRKEDILLTGERKEESPKRAGYDDNYFNKKLRIKGHRPLLNQTTNEVFTAIRQAGLEPHPVYKHFTRLGCYCCVFNTISEWVQLYKHYPKLFFEVASLEREINYTVKQGITLPELVDKQLRQGVLDFAGVR